MLLSTGCCLFTGNKRLCVQYNGVPKFDTCIHHRKHHGEWRRQSSMQPNATEHLAQATDMTGEWRRWHWTFDPFDSTKLINNFVIIRLHLAAARLHYFKPAHAQTYFFFEMGIAQPCINRCTQLSLLRIHQFQSLQIWMVEDIPCDRHQTDTPRIHMHKHTWSFHTLNIRKHEIKFRKQNDDAHKNPLRKCKHLWWANPWSMYRRLPNGRRQGSARTCIHRAALKNTLCAVATASRIMNTL
jgi:hypothetical protein